jgi:hypothetical protein
VPRDRNGSILSCPRNHASDPTARLSTRGHHLLRDGAK